MQTDPPSEKRRILFFVGIFTGYDTKKQERKISPARSWLIQLQQLSQMLNSAGYVDYGDISAEIFFDGTVFKVDTDERSFRADEQRTGSGR